MYETKNQNCMIVKYPLCKNTTFIIKSCESEKNIKDKFYYVKHDVFHILNQQLFVDRFPKDFISVFFLML